jgi:nicotinate-nucleotide adenylyltransferase
MKPTKKIAIYSGSYNPIHNGHITIARHVLLHTDVDELWFVVSPQNPLKKSDDLWNENHRLEMVKLAVQNEPEMRASDYEFNLPKPSYTIKTLDSLTKDYPHYTFVLLVGGDNLELFEKWREKDRILNEYGLIVYPRPGYNREALEGHPKIEVVDAPLLDISSTMIRDRIANKEDFSELVPEPVNGYIKKNGLGV